VHAALDSDRMLEGLAMPSLKVVDVNMDGLACSTLLGLSCPLACSSVVIKLPTHRLCVGFFRPRYQGIGGRAKNPSRFNDGMRFTHDAVQYSRVHALVYLQCP
jgi:hypothetical protein